MRRGNPFSRQAANDARKRVDDLRKRYPGLDRHRLAERLINDKARLCALCGALTAIPAIMPGIGTLVAIASGLVVDITVLGYLLSRLVLELSTLFDHDPLSPRVQQEAIRIFGLAAGVQSAGKHAAKTAADVLARQAAAGGMSRPLFLMGLRASQRSVVARILPLAGVGLAALVTYLFARGMGRRMLAHYERTATDDWSGRTLDVDYRVSTGAPGHGRDTVI